MVWDAPEIAGCDTPDIAGCVTLVSAGRVAGFDAKLPTTGLGNVAELVDPGGETTEDDGIVSVVIVVGSVVVVVVSFVVVAGPTIVVDGSVTGASEVVVLALASPVPKATCKMHYITTLIKTRILNNASFQMKCYVQNIRKIKTRVNKSS